MGISKYLKNSNGVSSEYHRISDITKDHNQLKVVMYSYVDPSYREMEKEMIELSTKIPDLMKQMGVLTGIERTVDVQQELDSIQTKLNRYNELYSMKPFYAFSSTIYISYDLQTNISFEYIYEYIINGDNIFNNAESA